MTKILSIVALVLSLCPAVCFAQNSQEGYVVSADGVKIFYKVVGSGPELIAVHGGPGNTLNSILADLEPLAKDHTIIYYDQRGNGRSDLIRDRDKLSISKHIADLEAIREHFKLKKVTLLGNSWGGLLISFYAAAHPDRIDRLILHDPAEPNREFLVEAADEVQARIRSHYDEPQRKRWPIVSNPQTWMNAKNPRAICREFFALILPIYVAQVGSLTRFRGDVCAGSDEAVRQQQYINQQVWRSLGDYNILPQLKAVQAPVLVIHGAADPIPVRSSEAWASNYPNARLLLIKNAGHLSHVETPETFFPAVETFLNGEFPTDAIKVR
jgi:proline iminopeptidase